MTGYYDILPVCEIELKEPKDITSCAGCVSFFHADF